MQKILSLLAISLLISCKTQIEYVYLHDYCTLSKKIEASKEDKEALRASAVSEDFFRQLVNHNESYEQTCNAK